jgi:RNA polymerase sigma factor (sigma-70 family)
MCVYVEGSWKLLIPVEKYGDMLYRLSLSMLRNKQDAEDSVQDTFMRYLYKKHKFNDEEHEKAWLLRVCINVCKNKLRARKRHEYVSMEDLGVYDFTYKDFSIFDAVSKLPEKYKAVILLYYVEEYKVDEIAKILNISSSAVKKRLQRAREMLKVYEENI